MSRDTGNGFGEWGSYMNAKITKLEEQFSDASEPFRQSSLFGGFSIYVNGLTNPSADELKRIMMEYGGTYHHYERTYTTFIVASNLPDVKVRNMNLSKYISPNWVVDCVREKRILDYHNYLLYTNRKTSQPKLTFPQTKKVESNTNSELQTIHNSTNPFMSQTKVVLQQNRNVTVETIPQPGSTPTKYTMQPSEFDKEFELMNSEFVPTKRKLNMIDFEEKVTSITQKRLFEKNNKNQLQTTMESNTVNVVSNDNQNTFNESGDSNATLIKMKSDLVTGYASKISACSSIQRVEQKIDIKSSSENDQQPLTAVNVEQNSFDYKLNTMENNQHSENSTAITGQHQIDSKTPEIPTSSSTNSRGHALSAVNPQFINEFYNNSRLHLISTLSADLKKYINESRDNHENAGGFPMREQLKAKILECGIKSTELDLNSCIMHIDMDCFFVSVSLLNYPQFRGKPVAVTHSKGGSAAQDVPIKPGSNRQQELEMHAKRFEQKNNHALAEKVRNGFDAKMSLSEIASCSYEARQKGVRNGMFVGQALKICPDLKTIPYDFKRYKEVAYILYDTIAQYTLNIEAVSCDEMYVDLRDVLNELKIAPLDFTKLIRQEVYEKTGCTCSAGIGSNRLQARLATKNAKPNGQYHLLPEAVVSYMHDVPVEELPGVGSATGCMLVKANIVTCGDMQKVSLEKIQMLVGKKFGAVLHQFCRGIDNRTLTFSQVRKSVSTEINYGIRFTDHKELETFIRQICKEVHSRLTDIKRKTKLITLKIKERAKDAPIETSKFMGHGVCDTFNKSVALKEFTDDMEIITTNVLKLINSLKVSPSDYRGIGVQLSKLDEPPDELLMNDSTNNKQNTITNMFAKFAKTCNNLKFNEVEKEQNNSNTTDKELTTNEQEQIANVTDEIFLRPNIPKNELNQKQHKKSGTGRKPMPLFVTPKSKQIKSQTNILGMLQNTFNKKQIVEELTDNMAVHYRLPNDINPEVFGELPISIQTEILKEHGITNATAIANLMSNVTKQNAADKAENYVDVADEEVCVVDNELPTISNVAAAAGVSNENVSKPMRRNKMHKTAGINDKDNYVTIDNMFKKETDVCINLLLNWLKSQQDPFKIDVEVFTEQAVAMIRDNNVYAIYEPLTYLCRLINSIKAMNCKWHLSYKSIITTIQIEVMLKYGMQLLMSDSIACRKCKIFDVPVNENC